MSLKLLPTDERDLQVYGQSAQLTIQLFSLISIILATFLIFSRDLNPGFMPAALSLIYAICFLQLSLFLFTKFHDQLLIGRHRRRLYFLIILIVIAGAIFTLRFFAGEDDWLCQNGQWVKHGQPSFPAPTTVCP